MSGAAHEKRLELLDVELAIWRIPPGATIPLSILQPKSPLPFLSITRLPTELSIIAPASLAPLEGAERSWRALVMLGPLDFNMVGVLESALAPLAAADIPVMAISTYETDCILVREHDLERATAALGAAGYEFVE